jgi:HEAT repeat protein
MKPHEISSALESPDEEVRRTALCALREISTPDAQACYFVAMGDESWRVRKEAVESYLHSKPDSDSIAQLLELIRNEDNAGLRNSAAEAVVRLGSASAPPLIALVRDQDAEVRKFVIDIMGAIGDPCFVPQLLEALADPVVNVAAAAAEQLGALGVEKAAAPLLQAVLSRDEVLFRFSALGALRLLAQPAEVPDALVQLAGQDVLKKAVYECLGSIADARTAPLLLEGFSCRQKTSRAASVKALYKIYRRAENGSQLTIREALRSYAVDAVISNLLELCDGRDALLTDALLWICETTGNSRFIPLLLDAYSDDRTASGALSILKSFDRATLQDIFSRYSSAPESGRTGICILIAECGYTEFGAIIEEALHDPAVGVRRVAALAAGKLGLIASIAELAALIDDREPRVAAAAIAGLKSLSAVSRSSILAEVHKFSASPAPHQRKAAAALLASLGEYERLQQLLSDEDPLVRKAAATAAGECNSGGEACSVLAGSMLVAALADEDPDVRIAVADALGSLREGTTLDALECAMSDADIWVQSAVIKALAAISPSRADAIIHTIHTNAEGLLLITCLQILEETGGSGSEEIIRNALQNNDRDIVRQAAKSLERINAITPR